MKCMGRKYFWISLISITLLVQQSWAYAFVLTAGNTVTVDEDAGELVFRVQPDRDPQGSEQISFHYETVDGTALAGSDYTAISGDRIIDATDTAADKEIHVPILDDDVEEIL